MMQLPAGYTAQIDGTTLTILDAANQPIATASANFHSLAHEHRAYLSENAPDHLAESVIAWLETRSLAHFQTLAADRPAVLRFDFADRDPARYEQQGYTFAMAEDQMMRDLSQPIPDAPLPAGMQVAAWHDETAHEFYRVYSAAFRERPGFPDWDEATWRTAFTGYDEFRPAWSMLVRAADLQPAGYAICAAEPGEGWIVQMGVQPAFRRMGIGEAMLAQAMRTFQAAGLALAVLDVNVNNPSAARLYEKMGFVRRTRNYCYKKTINPDGFWL